MRHPQKLKAKDSQFFLIGTRLSASLEGLNCSLALSAGNVGLEKS